VFEATPLLILFSFTLFISAFLLFWVQLMFAKMILPALGGSPSVWNTCLFFFQATLLLGYGYSHLTTRWWGTRRQAIIHSLLLLLPIAFLPITVAKGWVPPHDANPVPWLLALLLVSVGLPFFVVSTSAPLVQKWFADTDHPASSDPYFLYTASNLGSMLGVLSYPILIEPNFPLTQQSWLWATGYGLLVFLTLGCAVCLWKLGAKETTNNLTSVAFEEQDLSQSFAPTARQQAQWVLLSFLPSSLLLGVTTYITTDIAAIPLLWAIPLAIYLLTFILTFARKPLLRHNTLVAVLPLLLAPLIVLSLLRILQPVWLLLPFHLIGFFILGCVFHGEVAKSRPSSQYLTIFYLWISVGGVLGGLFNAIAAPLLFPSVLEYPLLLGLSILILGTSSSEKERGRSPDASQLIFDSENEHRLGDNPKSKIQNLKSNGLSKTLPISIGLLLGSLIVGFQVKFFNTNVIGILVAFAILFAMRYAFALHPVRFGVGFALIVLLSQFYIPSMGRLLDTERSFFGVNRVLYDKRGNYNILLHGTTVHGKQSLDPQRRHEPLTYFHPSGPVGQLFKSFKNSEGDRNSNIAVLGLGIGSLAAYAEPGQEWTFYEIDPTVASLARDSRYFTFLQDSKAPFSLILGDGRLQLADVPANHYDLIFMDAFSSDAIPVHLVTQEAIQMYLSKLTAQGLLAINISNRYINLEPVLNALARNLGLSTLRQLELNISPEEKAMGKSASHWVLLARHQSDFGNLIHDSRWQPIPETLQAPLWTDDFSNIFGVLRAFSR
jgi:spermidine synthase